MSLQYYDINLATTDSKEVSAQGRYVYYLSGTTPLISGGITPSAAGNQAIKVRPSSGGTEIILMPGQSIRLSDGDKMPSAWRISNSRMAEQITGTIMVGEGEFGDSNTSGIVTIAGFSISNAQSMPVQKQALSTISNIAPVVINTGAAQALISDPTQRILRIRNSHMTAMLYLGAIGVTAANAAIVLSPGDMWIEEEAAGAAWYATSDTNGCSVQIQGLKL